MGATYVDWSFQGPAAQLVGTPLCHSGARGFKSPGGLVKVAKLYLYGTDVEALFGLVVQLVQANDWKSLGRRLDPGPSHLP